MSTKWLMNKKNEFLIYTLRNFCLIHKTLREEFEHYHQHGGIHFEVLADLLGVEMNQGRLWRLKDTTHLLFNRSHENQQILGKFLDWSIGYIFHECMKLKEDAYQLQTYVPWFNSIQAQKNFQPHIRKISEQLYQLTCQMRENIDRQVKRIELTLHQTKLIFISLLPHHRDNILLARLIYDQNSLVKEVFQSNYQELIQNIYGDNLEDLYILASKSLRLGGWIEKASQALSVAEDIDPDSPKIQQEKKIIENSKKRSNRGH